VQTSVATAILLPIALGIIMLGLGLTLTVADFTRVARFPRPVLIGLSCQMLILPWVCLLVAEVYDLPPELAVGLMLLAASPGGATANLFSHLARGDVALNITLTAINSVLSLVTLPFIVNFSMAHFMGEGRMIPLQAAKVIQVFAIVLVPVAVGMAIRAARPGLAERLNRPVKIMSITFLVVIVVGTLIAERGIVGDAVRQIGLAALTFNLASMLIGYLVPRAARVEKRQAIAIGMEIGIHNATLAIAIASGATLLNNPVMALPAAIYSILMFFTAAGFAALVNRGRAD
jgi:BASS family bile acid:Na+ symporter